MNCVICEKLENHYNGICSSSIYEFDNSLVVLGEHQFYKYYCMVLAKECVREVHHLPVKLRNNLMEEVFSVGAFLEEWTGCKKINYSCLGNAVPHIHWHIFPRYSDDPDFKMSPWLHFDRFKEFELDSNLVKQRANEMFKELRKYLAKREMY